MNCLEIDGWDTNSWVTKPCGIKWIRTVLLQVDYILGANPAGMSYMVGFSAKFPRHVHHRSASNPSLKSHIASIGCSDSFRYLYSSEQDPNVLTGAVVGGPDQDDRYSDSRDDYAQSEPTTYINAPLVGPLAWLAKPPVRAVA